MSTLTRTVAVLTLTAITLVAPVSAGTYFESTAASRVVDGETGAGGTTMVTHGWVDGEKGKILFIESDNPILKQESYLLTADGGDTLYFVNPAEQTYMEWDAGTFFGNLGAMMRSMGDMMKLGFEDFDTEKLAEEPGGEILGYPTTRYEYDTSYVMTIEVMGMTQRMEVSQRQEIWATAELEAPGFEAWLKKTPRKTGIEGLDEMIAEQMEKAIDGMPLKTVTVQTTTDQRGQTTKTRTTTEVTTIRDESIPAETFELPAGYERTEMPDLGAALSRQR